MYVYIYIYKCIYVLVYLYVQVYVFVYIRPCLVHVVDNRKIFCYYSTSAQNRRGLGKFTPENIDPDLCTHVIFAFAKVVDKGDLKASNWNDLPTDDGDGE